MTVYSSTNHLYDGRTHLVELTKREIGAIERALMLARAVEDQRYVDKTYTAEDRGEWRRIISALVELRHSTMQARPSVIIDDNGDCRCTCGNDPDSDGFQACDDVGTPVEPCSDQWHVPLMVCRRCGIVFHLDTARITNKTSPKIAESEPGDHVPWKGCN
jgi:hypothetical protein